MGDYGKKIRLNRFLRRDRGTLAVAFDHPLVHGPIPGTADPASQIRRFVECGADAVLLNFGMIRHFAEAAASSPMPGLIARLDWTTALSNGDGASCGSLASCLVARPQMRTL